MNSANSSNAATAGTAFITGGASGFGKAFAITAIKRNYRVVIADVQAKVLEQTAQELRALGGEVEAMELDVSDAAAVQQCADRIHEKHGAANLVFNNAGISTAGMIWESSDRDWDWMLDVNVRGVVNGVRSFVPKMLEAAKADPNYRGTVINTASMAALITAPGMGIYSVTKHAVLAISECLMHDLSLFTRQVTASCLCPTHVATGIITNSDLVRPARYANEAEPTEFQKLSRAAAAKAVEQGTLTPEYISEFTFKAIDENRFFIFPMPEALEMVKPRFDHTLNQTNPNIDYERFPWLLSRRMRLNATIQP